MNQDNNDNELSEMLNQTFLRQGRGMIDRYGRRHCILCDSLLSQYNHHQGLCSVCCIGEGEEEEEEQEE